MKLGKGRFESLSAGKRYLLLFFISLITALSFFLPYIIADKGCFVFYGDYSVQQIPFYMHAARAVQSGNIFWDFTTDLGANFLGSYSYYMLGSPFFWAVCWLPYKLMPLLLPLLLCLKIAIASVTSCAYIERMGAERKFAFIGGLLYAFSGFSIYNIFFNQFHEAIAFFPLLLLGLEELMEDGRKGRFCIAVFINAMANFYLFIAECFFLLIYFLVRLFCRSFKNFSFKRILHLIAEGILGIGMAGAYLLIAYLSVSQVPRAFYKLSGYSMLFYGNVQNYANILESFFFPSEMPAFPNFFNDISAKWSSIAAYLPLFGMIVVIAYIRRRKKDFISVLLPLLFFFSFIPILNSLFQLFSNSFYTRWFFMLTLIMALATAKGLSSLSDTELKEGFKISLIMTLLIALPVLLIPSPDKAEKEHFYERIGLFKYWDRFLVSVLIAGLCLFIAYILLFKVKRYSSAFFGTAVISLCIIASLCGNYFIATGRIYKTAPKNADTFISRNIEGSIDLPDIENVRTDVYKGIDNQTMFWDIPGVQAFHTIVPGSVTEFYTSLGVTRDVGSRPDTSHVFLRSLISCRYLLDASNSDDFDMYGFNKIGEQNGFTVYENENWLPIGFTYDHYIDDYIFKSVSETEREKLLLRGIYLSEEQIAKYGNILSLLPSEDCGYMTAAETEEYIEKRRAYTLADFSRDNKGFGGNIDVPEDTLLFVSVPYEKGWSAEVNGESAEIEKVNCGLMAVKVNAGHNSVRFSYETPGLKTGLMISGASFLIFIIYMVCAAISRRKKKR